VFPLFCSRMFNPTVPPSVFGESFTLCWSCVSLLRVFAKRYQLNLLNLAPCAVCLNAHRIYPEVRTMICTAFLLNGLWLITNGLAVVENVSYWSAVSVLVAYAVFLWMPYLLLEVDYKGPSLVQKIVVYAPLSLNMAWVTLAALLNFSNTAMNSKLDFSKKENRTAIGGPDWAMGIFTLAGIIAAYLCIVRSDFVYGLGTIWALQGVVRHQTKGSGFPHPVSDKLRDFAQVSSIILAVCVVVAFLRMVLSRVFAKSITQQHPISPRSREKEIVVNELKARFVPLKES